MECYNIGIKHFLYMDIGWAPTGDVETQAWKVRYEGINISQGAQQMLAHKKIMVDSYLLHKNTLWWKTTRKHWRHCSHKESFVLSMTNPPPPHLPRRHIHCVHFEQVALRATIAHLSPMCQHPLISNKPASKVIKNLNSFQIREQLFFQGLVPPMSAVWMCQKSNLL